MDSGSGDDGCFCIQPRDNTILTVHSGRLPKTLHARYDLTNFCLSDTLLTNLSTENKFMSNLQDFFKDLQNWEGQQYRELIHPWPQDLRNSIVSAFENAVPKSSVKGSVCSLPPGITNQAIGNEIEKYIAPKLDRSLVDFSISKCRDSGYPDQILIQHTQNLHIPLEFKATKDWNKKDSIRRVLTSSSNKLRTQFVPPIHHLLLTVLYSKEDEEDFVTIDTIRLDFIESTTTVNVRLEASLNHKILVNDPHYIDILPQLKHGGFS